MLRRYLGLLRRRLVGRSLGRWGLDWVRLGMGTTGLHLGGGQFTAVAEELANQDALGFDGLTLLNDQQSHEPVGDQEQDYQQRQPAIFLSRDGGIGECSVLNIRTEKRRQSAPQYSP